MIDLLVVCCFGGLQATHLTLYSFDQRLHTFYLGLAKRLIDTDRISLFSCLYPDSGATYILDNYLLIIYNMTGPNLEASD